jgi:UDP-glucose 4-epimerase
VAVSVVRPFSVYGPGMREGFAVRGFLEQVQRRADPVEVWGDAGQVRDYIHVSDVAAAVVAMAEQGIDGPVNLGTGRGTSLAELVALMGEAAGYEPGVKVNTALPAGVQSLVADATLLRSFCPPRVVLEDYLAEAVRE